MQWIRTKWETSALRRFPTLALSANLTVGVLTAWIFLNAPWNVRVTPPALQPPSITRSGDTVIRIGALQYYSSLSEKNSPIPPNLPALRRPAAEPDTHSGRRERRFHPLIVRAAKHHQLDPDLVKALIRVESDYNPRAVSKRGAAGLMQLMPETAQELGVKDIFDPEHNINGGVKYLRRLLDRFDGDLHMALAAYNAGSRKVLEHRGIPPIEATRRFLRHVLHHYQLYKRHPMKPSADSA